MSKSSLVPELEIPRLSFAQYLETSELGIINLAWISLMLQNGRVTTFTVSECLRENQQEGGGKITPSPPPSPALPHTYTLIFGIIHFWSIFSFYTPWKHKKPEGFIVFPVVTKWEHCPEMCWSGPMQYYWVRKPHQITIRQLILVPYLESC